jgi:hypothetical protein
VADQPAQLGRIQVAGGLEHDWFGGDCHVVGQVVGAVDDHPGMGNRELSIDQGLGGSGQGPAEPGPGGPDGAVGSPRDHA